jgi:hypothetical protein
MTLLQDTPQRACRDEEVLPLMHAQQQLARSSSAGSASKPLPGQAQLPVHKRVHAVVRSVTPELVAIALGALCVRCAGPGRGKRHVRDSSKASHVHVSHAVAATHMLCGVRGRTTTAVYFVQGILKLSSLAVTFFLKDHLGLEPAQVWCVWCVCVCVCVVCVWCVCVSVCVCVC